MGVLMLFFEAGVLKADGEKYKMRVNVSLEQLILPGAYPAPLLPSRRLLDNISFTTSPLTEHLDILLSCLKKHLS